MENNLIDKNQHHYLKTLLIKHGLDALAQELLKITIEPEAIFGLVAYYIEYRIDKIEDLTSIIEKYSDIIIPELPRLVDNASFDFFNWDVWLEPIKIRQMEVYTTDPLGSSIKTFIWFLIISKMKGFNQISSPKSLEIREKTFLEALEFISSRKNLDKDLIRHVENQIRNWASERRIIFWDELEKKPIDEKRENSFKHQVREGFNRIIYPDSLLKSIINDDPKFDYRKFDLIINVPKTLLVEKASDFTEYGVFGAGGSFGESIARGINKYILDQIRQNEPESISFDEINQRVLQGEKAVCNIKLWRRLLTESRLKRMPLAQKIGDLPKDDFETRIYPERSIDSQEAIITPSKLGLLIKKSDLGVTIQKDNERDSKTNEPMVLFRIKIVFHFQKSGDVIYSLISE